LQSPAGHLIHNLQELELFLFIPIQGLEGTFGLVAVIIGDFYAHLHHVGGIRSNVRISIKTSIRIGIMRS